MYYTIYKKLESIILIMAPYNIFITTVTKQIQGRDAIISFLLGFIITNLHLISLYLYYNLLYYFELFITYS